MSTATRVSRGRVLAGKAQREMLRTANRRGGGGSGGRTAGVHVDGHDDNNDDQERGKSTRDHDDGDGRGWDRE